MKRDSVDRVIEWDAEYLDLFDEHMRNYMLPLSVDEFRKVEERFHTRFKRKKAGSPSALAGDVYRPEPACG